MVELLNRKKVGLALGSGGWKGIAHVGVIKALVENNIPIDFIAGSSAGALVGGMYCSLGDIYKVEAIINKFNKKDLLAILSDPTLKTGIIKGDNVVKFIDNNIGKVNIEDLKIPFCAVATDLLSGCPVYITKGSLSTAIRASSSFPVLFEPSINDGKYLIDGGATEMIPTEAVKKMGADVVIGVNLYKHSFPVQEFPKNRKKISKTEIALISYGVILNRLAKYCEEKADISIDPKITHSISEDVGIRWFLNFVDEKGLIKSGEEATLEVLTEIKKLAENNK